MKLPNLDLIGFLYYKIKLLLALLFFVQLGFAQNTPQERLLTAGQRAFAGEDYILAKTIYSQALDLNPQSRDVLYNLAATELSLGDTESACARWYELFTKGDSSGIEHIKEFCPDFFKGKKVPFAELDEKPKFVYRGKEHFLFADKGLNPIYLSAFIKRFSHSNYLNKAKGISRISFNVNKDGKLDCSVYYVGAKAQDAQETKEVIESFMRTLVVYIAGKKDGEAVDYFETHSLPINMLVE